MAGTGAAESDGQEDQGRWGRLAGGLMLLIAGVFLALHFVHLDADFPNHSPWMDWAKYTDEGWYGDGAIRHFERGSWYLAGDFNPAAALPVWPVLEGLVFRRSGVGIVPARALAVAVFGASLLAGYGLVRRWSGGGKGFSLAAPAGVLLLAVSPFCYAFMRLAILEPLLILLMLVALLVVSAMGPELPAGRRWGLGVGLGVLLPAMVLTKTTAVFLFPAVGFLLLARAGYRVGAAVRMAVLPAVVGGLLWLLYFGAAVRPRYLADYRYLFSANAYTGITWGSAVEVIAGTARGGMWMGRLLFPMAVVLAGAAIVRARVLLRNPLVGTLLLWAGGYLAFLAYHDNLQPRYYLVIAVPLTLVVPLLLEAIWRETRGWTGRGSVAVLAGVLVWVAVRDGRQTWGYVRAPEYTFVQAARGIERIVARDRGHSRLLLSISGSDLSLMTGLPSICDDFGTMELGDRVARYRPGWYASWNEVEDDKMDALTPLFHLERVAAFPAMDAPERNLLILYRLDPATEPTKRRLGGARPAPRRLRTRLGQQPSVTQLVH